MLWSVFQDRLSTEHLRYAVQTQRLKFLKKPLEDSEELQMTHFQLWPHSDP